MELIEVMISNEQKAQTKKLSAALHHSITSRTKLTEDEVDNLDIGDIERKVGIKPFASRTYFSWEIAEKDGWQNSKFVGEDELERREQRVSSDLAKIGE